jgi:hypothetical protein
MPSKKSAKKIQVRDLKPRKDTKGGARVAQGGPRRQATDRLIFKQR